MADEITVNSSLQYVKGGRTLLSRGVINQKATQTGNNTGGGIFTCTTAERALAISEVATAGWTWIQNLDATNYVEIGPATGSYLLKLKAGVGCAVPLDKTTLYVKANAASVDVEIWMLEE